MDVSTNFPGWDNRVGLWVVDDLTIRYGFRVKNKPRSPELNALRTEVQKLKGEISSLKNELQFLKEEQKALQEWTKVLQGQISSLQGPINGFGK